jgi:hypothetical protein
MPTQQLALIASLLNMAKPDLVLFMGASLLLSPLSGGETTWDMANRICDRYFSDPAQQDRSVTSQAA